MGTPSYASSSTRHWSGRCETASRPTHWTWSKAADALQPERDRRRLGIGAFLLICFGITWGSTALALYVVEKSKEFWLYLPAAFGPAIACFAVRRWITKEGFADAGLRLSRRPALYIPAILVGPAIAITDILLVMVLAEGERISLSSEFQRAGSPFSYLAIVAVISIFLAGVEEFGWRGYLQLKVSPGRPLIAAIVTGTVWGIWHWPQVWFGDVYFYDVEVGFAHYVVFAIFFSIILGWLRLRTASIWPPTIAHASFNLAIGAYAIRGVLGFEYLVSISCFVWALVILLTGSLGRAAKEQSDR